VTLYFSENYVEPPPVTPGKGYF